MKLLSKVLLVLLSLIYMVYFASHFWHYGTFYGWELIGYNHMNDDFTRVCENRGNILIKHGFSDNVASKREDSFFFVVPTTILNKYFSITPEITHNLLIICFLGICAVCLAITLYKLKVNVPLAIVSMIYIFFAPSFLGQFFEFKLSVTSLALTAVVTLILICLQKSLNNGKKISYFYVSILPFLLINCGYEVFCISRPLNIFIFCFLFFYFLIYHRKHFVLYCLAGILSLYFIKLSNPDIKVSWNLFSARGESVVATDGSEKLARMAMRHARERAEELKILPKMPNDALYSAESTGDCAIGDLLRTSCVAVILLFFVFIFSKNARAEIFKQIRNRDFLIPLFIMSAIISLITPLGSTSFVRGHRLANFYYFLFIITIITLNFSLTKFNKYVRGFISVLLLVFACYYGRYKVNIFENYRYEDFETTKYSNFSRAIEKIKEQTKDIKEITSVVVCDSGNPDIFFTKPGWNGILYITGVACKTSGDLLVFEKEGNPCACSEEKGSLCIIKTSPEDVDISFVK